MSIYVEENFEEVVRLGAAVSYRVSDPNGEWRWKSSLKEAEEKAFEIGSKLIAEVLDSPSWPASIIVRRWWLSDNSWKEDAVPNVLQRALKQEAFAKARREEKAWQEATAF